jgi:hypothetical protein
MPECDRSDRRSLRDVAGMRFEYGFTPNWSAGIKHDTFFGTNNPFSTPIGVTSQPRIGQDVDMLFTMRVDYRIGGWPRFLDERPGH